MNLANFQILVQEAMDNSTLISFASPGTPPTVGDVIGVVNLSNQDCHFNGD
jgi:hypothetical protein